ncbi:MAG: RNA polymerase sigma factor [Planctomycetes bacterium]|nr:RNA polymerase sigma factor [Planctomycetota bacterium]
MTSPAFPLDPEALIADSAWLRALARGLVRDSFAADDLAQEAWLVALRAERAEGRPDGVERRTWLTGVLRHTAWKQHRSTQRRSAREQRGARAEPLPETAELVARAEMQRVLSDAVVALDEPFRTTILLRYLEDLSSAEIARRQSVPEGTVRWRVQRGLELLRAELEARRGGEWLHGCALVGGLLRLTDFAAGAQAAATSAPLASTALSGVKGAALSAATSANGAAAAGAKGAALTAASTSSTAAAIATAGASSTLVSLPSALLAASLVLGGGATAVTTGWIEAPWSDTTNRTASGSEDFVHASVGVSSLADEAQPTSPVEVDGGARATTPPRTPLAVRTDTNAPAEDAFATPEGAHERGVRIERRVSAAIDGANAQFGMALPFDILGEKQVFVVVDEDGGVRHGSVGVLDGLDEDLLDESLTDDERAEILARLKNRLVERGGRVFAGPLDATWASERSVLDVTAVSDLQRANVDVAVNVLLMTAGVAPKHVDATVTTTPR